MSFYGEKFSRNPYASSMQLKLQKTKFAIVGLGGTGGFILENLLRTGCENFVVYEHDSVELTNFNRQILATEQFIDRPKSLSAKARARDINGNAKIALRGKFTLDSDLDGVDILLDGSDNLDTKLLMAGMARMNHIPYVFCAANDSRGMVSVFLKYSFHKAFQIDESKLSNYRNCSTIACQAASLAGTIAASQAINLIIRKPVVVAPKAIFFDLSRREILWQGDLG